MFLNFLNDILPLNRILVSGAIGLASFLIVLIGGLSSDFVTGATVASRSLYAFACTGLVTFCIMMCCEEYAIFTTKRELEHFIDDAPLADTENFNRKEYLGAEDTEDTSDDFRPMDFENALPNQG